jgi:site-specific recombinase XerD
VDQFPTGDLDQFPSGASRTRGAYASWPKLTFSRVVAKAGLKGGPHTLRHTYGSHFLQTQPDLFLLAEVLGHSSTKTTKIAN